MTVSSFKKFRGSSPLSQRNEERNKNMINEEIPYSKFEFKKEPLRNKQNMKITLTRKGFINFMSKYNKGISTPTKSETIPTKCKSSSNIHSAGMGSRQKYMDGRNTVQIFRFDSTQLRQKNFWNE